jgi:hypothetical protein
MTPFEEAHRRLGAAGVLLERLPGEYRVRAERAPDTAWEAFEMLPDAVARGGELARALPPACVAPAAGKRRRAPVYATAKAWMKAQRKRHNARMRARLLRGG